MPEQRPDAPDRLDQLQSALSRWDTEGGAGPAGAQEGSGSDEVSRASPHPSSAEFERLRIRVIALENLVVTLLAASSDRQLDRANEMAAFISPRPGFTCHPVTIQAAAQMTNLVHRAGHFRHGWPSGGQ